MRSTSSRTKRSPSTSTATCTFGSLPVRYQRSTTVRPREGVVDRRAGQVVRPAVEAVVEVEELGDELPGPPCDAQLVGVLRRQQRLVRDVEADHRHVDAALEDAPGGLGIGPDVELR